MTRKDLTAYLAPNLELPWRDRLFVVKPPTKDAGIKLAAINAIGVQSFMASIEACPTCGRTGTIEIPQSTLDVIEAIGDTDIGVLSLGQDVYDEMLAAGVPGPDVDTFALYALYYWTLGEETADSIMSAQAGDVAGEAPSGSSTQQRGPRTASASRTPRPGSTRGTAGSRRR